ncbi:MAG: transglutaminase domain-containing protein [Actinobacteria bacterium]|nr:transglutaminase domain-containing protein [Actinomycetota bacterium]
MSDTITSGLGGTTDASTGRFGRTRAYRPWVPTPDARRPMLADAALAAALGLLAVQAFAPSFGGNVWWSIGGLGVLVGALIAYAIVQFKLSPVASVLATVAGFFIFGAHAVPDASIAGWVPGPSTPGALFDGITHGWARLMTTVPPVGTVDHIAAIVFGCGYFATLGALLLARRTSSVWLPSVLPMVVAVVAILVGTHQPASTLAQGGALAFGAVIWASVRSSRNRPRVHVVGANAWTTRATAATFVVLIAAAALLVANAAAPSTRFVLRDHTQPPFDPNNYPSPLTGFPKWRDLAQPKSAARNQTVMTVSGMPASVPVRVAVMDVYDGNVWLVGGPSNTNDLSGSGRFRRVGSDLSSTAAPDPGTSVQTVGPTTKVDARISLEHYNDVWVPTFSGARSMSFGGADSRGLAQQLRFNTTTESAAVGAGISSGSNITVRASVPVVSYVGGAQRDAIVGSRPADPGVALPPIVDTPTGQNFTVKSEADKLSSGAKTDYKKAKDLESGLRRSGQAFYSDGINEVNGNPFSKFSSGHNLYQLGQFLSIVNPNNANTPMFIGNSERYAAAMAVMARLEGLPARVVMGFRASVSTTPARTVDGVTTFTPDQADAWVEIAFKGVGWVGFFPTPPRTQNDIPKQPDKSFSKLPADVQAQPPVSPPPNPAILQKQNKDKHSEPTKSNPFHIPAWVWLLLKIIFYPLILIAAIVGAIRGLKEWRRRRRRSRGSPVDRVAGAWAEMLDHLRDLGAKVPRKGTRLEVAGAIPTDVWEPITGFAAGINAAMFGPDDPTDESAESIWVYVDEQRAETLEGLERKRRWLTQLNLASLKPWR